MSSSSSPPGPGPISQDTIRFLLQHIVPPPQSVLPPHLLSPLLLQRHHFLRLDPIQDPVAYLAWPSEDQHRVAHLLQSLSLESLPTHFPVSYTSDPEATFAHARITPDDHSSSGLRLVFYWQPDAGWKYHNIALMPFPPSSYSSLLFRPIGSHDSAIARDHDDNDDDAYWNSYSHSDSFADPPHEHTKDDAHLSSEDAYWAQYATVQGSADSTVPSPLPVKRKLVQPYHLHTPEPVYNPLQPPSPDALARRLRKLEPRPESPPLVDDATSLSASIAMTPSSSPPVSDLPTDSPKIVVMDEEPSQSSTEQPILPTDLLLQQSIQGIYNLWKASRPNQRHSNDQELFLSLARQAISSV
ncbi:hypothetical protein AX16_009676 [Volvariella volvacea WC 439]|nr:hypothetical protein AX16_009676 [Volvariella volvacea WC 439]